MPYNMKSYLSVCLVRGRKCRGNGSKSVYSVNVFAEDATEKGESGSSYSEPYAAVFTSPDTFSGDRSVVAVTHCELHRKFNSHFPPRVASSHKRCFPWNVVSTTMVVFQLRLSVTSLPLKKARSSIGADRGSGLTPPPMDATPPADLQPSKDQSQPPPPRDMPPPPMEVATLP